MSADEWTYEIANAEAWSSFRYRVKVYRGDSLIGDSRTDTLWGARKDARRIKRRAIESRPGDVVDSGVLL